MRETNVSRTVLSPEAVQRQREVLLKKKKCGCWETYILAISIPHSFPQGGQNSGLLGVWAYCGPMPWWIPNWRQGKQGDQRFTYQILCPKTNYIGQKLTWIPRICTQNIVEWERAQEVISSYPTSTHNKNDFYNTPDRWALTRWGYTPTIVLGSALTISKTGEMNHR